MVNMGILFSRWKFSCASIAIVCNCELRKLPKGMEAVARIPDSADLAVHRSTLSKLF